MTDLNQPDQVIPPPVPFIICFQTYFKRTRNKCCVEEITTRALLCLNNFLKPRNTENSPFPPIGPALNFHVRRANGLGVVFAN